MNLAVTSSVGGYALHVHTRRKDARSFIVALDGQGCWDRGDEASDWMAQELKQNHREVLNIEEAVPQLHDLGLRAVDRFSGLSTGEMKPGFSCVAVCVEGRKVDVAFIGCLAVEWYRAKSAQVLERFVGRRWVEDMMEAGYLSEVQADAHPLAGVFTGPFVGESPFCVQRGWLMEAGDRVTVVPPAWNPGQDRAQEPLVKLVWEQEDEIGSPLTTGKAGMHRS